MSFTSGAPWPVDVVTSDHLISGFVEGESQRWGGAYFHPFDPSPAAALQVDVAATHSTSGLAPLAWVGARASFTFHSGMLAVIPRGDAAVAVWAKGCGSLQGVPAVVLIGPYALSGTVLSADGTVASALLAHAVAVRDATLVRADGRGDGTPIAMPCAIITTQFLQAAAGPRPPM